MLALDNVELEFTEEALAAVSEKAIERKTGARGYDDYRRIFN